MEHKASTARRDLEQLLVDETAEPKPLPLSLLEDITGDFSDHQEIGSGGFAVVYKGILDDRVVAVKKLSDDFMDENKFHREVECLMRVKHKNVVRFLGYCADRQGNMERYEGKLVMADVHQRLLCFEYIPNGSLDKYIHDPHREWGMCYKIIKEICEGLQNLHDNRIVHLDLKPANIMLDDNLAPKITDFGLSRCFNENQSRDITKNILGTIGYMAPEFNEGGVIACSADIYSLGVIIIEILTGQKGYQSTEDVLESWRGRLERSQQETQCEQIRVCYETALECREFNPMKRPASALNIIDRLHQMENIQERTVLLRIKIHCNGCAKKIKRVILCFNGVKRVVVEAAKEEVKVVGTMDVAAMVLFLQERLGRRKMEDVVPDKKGEKKDNGGSRDPEEMQKDEAAAAGVEHSDKGKGIEVAVASIPPGKKDDKMDNKNGSRDGGKKQKDKAATAGVEHSDKRKGIELDAPSMAPTPAPVAPRHGSVAYPQQHAPSSSYYNYYGGIATGVAYATAGSYYHQPSAGAGSYNHHSIPQPEQPYRRAGYLPADAPQIFSDENPNACSIM